MKRIYIDMDNVLVDFKSGIDRIDEATRMAYDGRLDVVPGIFSLMDPMPGAIEAVHRLAEKYDLFILSTAPWKNPSAWADKVSWVTKYLGDVLEKRLILSHRKDLLKGDYLIDDRPKHGADTFDGEWIRFGTDPFPDWKSVLEYLDR
jgi:5'(3')-deoxyribonucleotidase